MEKHVVNLKDKTEYVIHIRNLKQALNHGLEWQKVHRIIKFNQKAWLNPCIDENTDLRKKEKMILKNIFLNWWIMQFSAKLWKMWKKNRNIKLVTIEKRRNYLVSEPNYHTKFLVKQST